MVCLGRQNDWTACGATRARVRGRREGAASSANSLLPASSTPPTISSSPASSAPPATVHGYSSSKLCATVHGYLLCQVQWDREQWEGEGTGSTCRRPWLLPRTSSASLTIATMFVKLHAMREEGWGFAQISCTPSTSSVC